VVRPHDELLLYNSDDLKLFPSQLELRIPGFMPRDKSIFSSPVSSGQPVDSTVGKGLIQSKTHKNMKKKKEEDKAAGSCMGEGRLALSHTVIFGFTPEQQSFLCFDSHFLVH
jgi:hypothetical protein